MLTERQQSILEAFLQNPDASLTAGDLLPLLDVGRTTLFRDLSAMVEAVCYCPTPPPAPAPIA
jgi:DeoR/GlpR family transcriptional regulator of sugar metabolism